MTESEKYLIDNKINYFKSDNGVIIVNINEITKEKFKKYHQFIYILNKKPCLY